MCGIAALFSSRLPVPAGAIEAMTGAIRHRGPDGEGYVHFVGTTPHPRGGADTQDDIFARTPSAYAPMAADPPAGCALAALGHRRLAIIDLSPTAHQPMCDAGGRFWMTYNGEVYNYVELRAELEALGHEFISQSDTEVILAAYAQWGTEALARFNGMFALVIYDRRARRIFAARDRFGVKPLYWWQGPGGLLAFASEIKQFTCLPGWRAQINGQRAYEFLNWGIADHGAETLFSGVQQLRGGQFIELDIDKCAGPLTAQRWYTPPRQVLEGIGFDEAAARFHDLFVDSIRLRLRADVEVGTGLSGGLDSSSVVGAVHVLLGEGRRHNAFSARSHDPAYDEGQFIDAVVRRCGIRQHNVYPEPEELFSSLPDLVNQQDEPYGSASIFAQWKVFSLAASKGVKVTLDGHGSDEIVAGYPTFIAPRILELIADGRIGAAMGEWFSYRGMGCGPVFVMGHLIDVVAPPLAGALRRAGGRTAMAPDWIAMERLGARAVNPLAGVAQRGNVRDWSIAQLTGIGLPQMLHWADRSSMASSVESREPFLDYRLVEFALSLPAAFKISGGETKRVLRSGLGGLLPAGVRGRRDKKGFITAEARWATRDCPDRFLAAVRQAVDGADGILTRQALARAEAVTAGRQPYHASLWRMISFGGWVRQFSVQRP